MRVLIVEDDEVDASHMTRILRRVVPEASILFAKTLEDAAVQVVRDQPDVMILDLTLPPATAFDTLKLMNSHIKVIPTLVVTGHADAEAALQAIEEGALGFLLKSKLDTMLPKMFTEVVETGRT